jgi:hypothetical protein
LECSGGVGIEIKRKAITMTRQNTMPTNFRHHVLTSASHLTVPELADSYQVTEPTIRNWMRLTGVGKRPVKNGVDKARIEVMLERGFRVVEIARLMGCSKSSIDKHRRNKKLADDTLVVPVEQIPMAKSINCAAAKNGVSGGGLCGQ